MYVYHYKFKIRIIFYMVILRTNYYVIYLFSIISFYVFRYLNFIFVYDYKMRVLSVIIIMKYEHNF